MKNARRWLAAMLCMFMMSGIVPSDVVAEPVGTETVAPAETIAAFVEEAEVGDTSEGTDTAQQEIAGEAEIPAAGPETHVPTQEPAVNVPTEEPAEPAVEPDKAMPDGDVVDTEKDATYSPAFAEGYAWVLRDAFAYPDATDAAEAFVGIYAENIVYVSDRKTAEELDRLQVSFSSEGREATTAWMNAKDLRPMSEAETEAFVEARVKEEDVEYHPENGKIPLPLVTCLFREDYLAGLADQDNSPQKAPDAEEGDDQEEPAGELKEEILLPSVEDAGNLKQEELVPSIPATEENGEEPEEPGSNPEKPGEGEIGGEAEELKEEELLPDEILPVGAVYSLRSPSDGDGQELPDAQELEGEALPIQAQPFSVYVGESVQLTAEHMFGETAEITAWTSEGEAATVSEGGLVTGAQEGTAKLTATTADGRTAVCEVTVTIRPVIIADAITVYVGVPVQVTATHMFGEALENVSWTIEGAAATVSETGLVSGIEGGEALLRATAADGRTAQAAVTVKNVGMILNTEAITVGKGETFKITGSFTDGESHSVSFAAAKKSIATVTAGGTVKGVYPGSTTITVTSDFGESVEIPVTVKKAPSSVTMTPAKATMGVGEENCMTVKLSSGSASELTFSSDKPGVVEVDQEGNVIAKAVGTAKIKVKTFNGRYDTSTITVKPAPESISLDAESITLGVDQTWQLDPAITSGSYTRFKYDTDGSGFAAVDADGLITAVAPGKTLVTARTHNGLEASVMVDVRPAPTGVELGVTEITLGVGQVSAPLNVTLQGAADCYTGLTFKSSKTRYATVNDKGEIKGVRAGSATITVSTHNGHTAKVKVTVKKAPSSVKVSPTSATMGVGQVDQLKLTFTTGSACSYGFYDYDPAVLSVSETGEVTALQEGSTKITVKTHNNKKAYCTITVKKAPEFISIGEGDLLLGAGQEVALPTALSEGSGGRITYTTSNAAAVKVSSDGMLEAVGVGEAEITAETYNGWSASRKVTVKAAPSKITVTPKTITIGVGEIVGPLDVVLGAEGEDCEGSYTLKSSSTRYVKVNEAGELLGVRAGKATITYTTHNKKTAKVTVTVKKAPTSITMTPANVVLGVGEETSLSWELSSNSAGGVTMKEYDDSVISVSEDNVVKALSVGVTDVTVETYNGESATCRIEVKPEPEYITLSENEKTLGVGQSFKLSAVLNEGSAGAYKFISSDPTKATVDAKTGEVKAIAAGEVEIRAEAYNKKNAICKVTVKAAPSKITVTPKTITIGVGEIVGPLDVVLGAEGEDCEGSYTLKSSSTYYAKVNTYGQILGVRAGKATITYTTHNKKTAKVTVTVKKAPTSITVTPQTGVLGVGETGQLKWKLSTGSVGGVEFVGYDKNFLSVSETGLVTAIAPGTTTVTVRTFNGHEAYCTITVKNAPTGVTLEPAALMLGKGEKAALRAVLEGDGIGSYGFSSDNTAVAKVNAKTGEVTAVDVGTANITVETYNKWKATVPVKVSAAPTGIRFREESVTIVEGDVYQLQEPILEGEGAQCSGYEYVSSNESIMTVSPTGQIKGLKAGTARVKVSTYNDAYDVIYVYVTSKPASVWFDPAEKELYPGEAFMPEIRFGSGTIATYELSVPEEYAGIVAIGEDLRTVRALQPGTAQVQVTAFGDLTATMTVKVIALPDSVELNAESATIGQRETFQLKATMPENQGSSLEYTSSDNSIATVDASGLVRGVNPGTATITVKTLNDKTDTFEVTVKAAPTKVTLTPEEAVRSIEEQQLQLTIGYGAKNEGGSYEITSSDEEIATVSHDGLVTFVSTGIVEITIETYNNYTATSVITIADPAEGIEFAAAEVKIAKGDSVYVPVKFTSGGGSYTLAAEDGTIASVDGNWVKGLEIGSTTLKATTYNGKEATCTVTVVAAPTAITLDWVELGMSVGEEWQLTATTNAEDGVGSYTFSSSNSAIVTVDEKSGLVTALDRGEATITVTTYDGLCTADCIVKVTGLPTYRAMIAGEYAKSTDKGHLPFSANNVKGMKAGLELADIDGIRYAGNIASATNAGKDAILNQIRTQFRDAKPYDVSVIYLCAHGLRQVAGGSEYVLTMTGYEANKTAVNYITATELMAAVSTVPGKVILILDSCYSGGFLEKFAGQIESNPNLAVLCSSEATTRSSYWNVTGKDSVDFFTYSLLEGIGYEEKTGVQLALNADVNGDNAVTIAEAAVYANSATRYYVTTFGGNKKFFGNVNQNPVYAIGGMEDIIFSAR